MRKFVYPDYEGGSLLNVPSTVLKLFNQFSPHQPLKKELYQNISGSEKIILFLVDGLGEDLFEKEALKYPFFQKLTNKGYHSPITSIFPSATPPAANTLVSALSPLEHGLIEWYLYLQEVDSIVQSLPFTPVFEEDKVKLKESPKGILFDEKTIFQRLLEKNIPSFTFCSRYYSKSFYNQTSFFGSEVVSYETIADLLVSLREKMTQTLGKAYFYVYWPAVDHCSHDFGPNSSQVAAELSLLSYMMESEFIQKLDQKSALETGLVLTADHGQIEVNLDKTIYLDEMLNLKESFQISRLGKTILPTGSGRDLYLHIKEEKLEEVQEVLKGKLKDWAEVITIDQALKIGLFGPGKIHHQFLNRVGNLLILPSKNNCVWYRYQPEDNINLIGQHGGLSREEMVIPLITAKLSDFK